MTADNVAKDPGADLFALSTAVRAVSAERVAALAREIYGFDGAAEPLTGERSENFIVRSPEQALILRFSGAQEDRESVGLQIAALEHVAVQDPALPVPRVVRSRGGPASVELGGDLTGHILYAQTVMPGRSFDEVPRTEALLEDVGRVLARLDRALRGFYHPWAPRRLAWDVRNAPVLRRHTGHIEDPDLRCAAEAAFDGFIAQSLPRFGSLRSQFIHNDAHPGNLFVAPEAPESVSGLIDFGDMVHGPLILELAVACADQMGEGAEPYETAAPILRGYSSVTPIETEELAPLYDAMLARCAAVLAVAGWRRNRGPGTALIRPHVERAYGAALETLLTNGRDVAVARLGRAAQRVGGGLPRRMSTGIDALVARRHRLLGSHLALSYREPLHFVRGEDVWLIAADGRRYLDVYNNVPHVGHAHPYVVEAIARQAALLNTNTRYLHETVLDYAERLLATMPEGLDVCVFMNSGSEANDVAWQMAQAWSGARGALVMENAYHGITDGLVPLSPYDVEPERVASHVRTLEPPDGYREQDAPVLAKRHGEAADGAIAFLAQAGLKPAALMVDTGFTSGGILDAPQGYLALMAAKVRAAGGLFIADEVQYGFGRPGSHFWGFGRNGVVPDIVTLGKPIGNGYPIGAVVTRREILDAFTRKTDYFSTFGGNPVAAAAALAVLDVLQAEGLQANAAETGAYFRSGLERLKEAHPAIGDVRGKGFLIGVDLVSDPRSRARDRHLADRVKNRMRMLGVLVGSTGTHGNVLKIRPPMSFRRNHVDEAIAALDRALADEGM
jgi:4-aminobutyrate aminotransferase-like enzyme/Ser/Thr protein kinase RdoA (MazF antagonist)